MTGMFGRKGEIDNPRAGEIADRVWLRVPVQMARAVRIASDAVAAQVVIFYYRFDVVHGKQVHYKNDSEPPHRLLASIIRHRGAGGGCKIALFHPCPERG